MGGRPNYQDERPHGRYMGRMAGGYQGGPSETLIFILLFSKNIRFARSLTLCASLFIVFEVRVIR